MERIDKMSPERVKPLLPARQGRREGYVRVRPELRKLITFKQLNLLADGWPISGQFDVIFCRNVMIYFDKPTQSKILSRFVPLMKPDALLFAGHSENFLYVSDALKLAARRSMNSTQRSVAQGPSHEPGLEQIATNSTTTAPSIATPPRSCRASITSPART
jgi:chemotaxis protein methyltransferase CheR